MSAPCIDCKGLIGRLDRVAVPADVTFSAAERLAPPPDLLGTVVGDDLVIFTPALRRGVVLNPTSALVFTAFDGRLTLAQVVDQVADEVGLAPSAIEADVFATAARLQVAGLLEDVDVAEAAEGTTVSLAAPPAPTLDRPPAPAGGAPTPSGASVRERRLSLAGEPVVVATDCEACASLLDGLVADLAVGTWHDAEGADHGAAERTEARCTLLRSAGPDGYVVTVPGGPSLERSSPEAAVDALLHHLDRLLVERSDEAILLHAGAVERQGRVVVIAGASGMGKSTLTAALTRHGYRYLTDEVVVVDPVDHQVRPYPKAFDLSPTSLGLLDARGDAIDLGGPKRKVPARSFGEVSVGGRVALVVLLHDGPGLFAAPGSVVAEPLDPVEAMVGLLPVTFERALRSPPLFAALGRLCEQVPVVRVPRARVASMVQAIDETLGGG